MEERPDKSFDEIEIPNAMQEKILHAKTLIENLPVIQSAMKQLKGERLLHPEWEPGITYDNKILCMESLMLVQ